MNDDRLEAGREQLLWLTTVVKIVTTELLQHEQQLEGRLRQAESIAQEGAAEVELARRDLSRAGDEVAEQQEEAEHQQESVE